MNAAEKYIKDNGWVWGVLGAVVLIVAVAIVVGCCIYCQRRRRRRRGVYYVDLRSNREQVFTYGSMEMKKSESYSNSMTTEGPTSINGVAKATTPKQEEGVLEAWTAQRRRRESSEREAAFLTCQFYLRNTRSFSMLHPLPDLGSRVAKYWFMVSPVGQEGGAFQMVLTLAPVSKLCPIILHRENLKVLNALLAALKHPYLYSVQFVDYLPDHVSVVMVTHYFPKGSLKDMIYRRQPTNEWSEKYSLRKRGLPPETIPLYGRQILEALRVLYRKGFPQLGHIQSGNIFVDGTICRLSGYENTLLGYNSRHYRLIKDHSDSMDTIMFGHLLFEMICGYELTTLSPSNTDWENIKDESQIEVLRYIFSAAAKNDGSFPTIVDILDLPYFKSVQLPETENWDSSQIQLTSEMKTLLRTVRKGRPAQAPDQQMRRRTFSAQTHYYPITQPPGISRSSSTSSGATRGPPPPPPSHSPPPPSTSSPSSLHPHDTTDRTALLSDIQRGTRLKKTETNDRSAPRI